VGRSARRGRPGSLSVGLGVEPQRLAINELRSARARRERYVGEWLPEPIITDGRDDPAQHAQTADSLSLAMLVLLESLSPEQRAVLLLSDVFDYRYAEIAGIIGKSEDNVRQLATRTRRHVERRRPRFQTTREQRDAVTRRPRGRGAVAIVTGGHPVEDPAVAALECAVRHCHKVGEAPDGVAGLGDGSGAYPLGSAVEQLQHTLDRTRK
jgi:hypothetical protein